MMQEGPIFDLSTLYTIATLVHKARPEDVVQPNGDDGAFPNIQEAAQWFNLHCFHPSIGILRAHKDKEATPYANVAPTLLSLLGTLPIKRVHIPVVNNWRALDFIHVCGGQAITLAENMHTLFKVMAHLGSEDKGFHTPILYISQHTHFGYPSSVEQYQVALALVPEMDVVIDPTPLDALPKKYARHLAERIVATDDTQHVRFLPCRNGREAMEHLCTLLTQDCPDRALTGIIISTQPEQLGSACKEIFGRTPHTIHQAYIPHSKITEIKGRYWNETPQVTALFALLDLCKILHEQ